MVDDDKIACLNTSSCLREIGINSECVYSGREAIEKVRQHHLAEKEYFAVIIDLKMPQMNGIETTRQIRRFVGADVPIIILSAYDLEEYEAEAKKAGIPLLSFVIDSPTTMRSLAQQGTDGFITNKQTIKIQW